MSRDYDPRSFPGLADARRVLMPITDPRTGAVVFELEADSLMEDVERYWDLALAQSGRERRRTTTTVPARVDHGRWLADCPGPCRGFDAALVIPGWEKACCLGCGTEFIVSFPSWLEIAAASAALSARPVDLRNWDPVRESAEELALENKQRGL